MRKDKGNGRGILAIPMDLTQAQPAAPEGTSQPRLGDPMHVRAGTWKLHIRAGRCRKERGGEIGS